jgi:formylglycine-generating enzyme required for sulfatase activity
LKKFKTKNYMKNRSDEEETKLPVNNVSWYDCQDFMKKINTKTTGGYSLPSEAEWEFAWRAGTKTPYSFEDNITSLDVNYGVSKVAKPLVIAATSLMPLAYMICMGMM